MFKTAKSLNATETKVKGKKERKQVDLVGVEKLAHLDAIIKSATAAKAVIESTISDEVRQLFLEEIDRTGGMKPESFDAIEGLASVNCQLRKRGANSALNAEEQELLKEHEVKIQREVITPELYGINPEYASNEKMMEQVEKALAKLGLPEDFIVKQEERVKYVVSEETLDKALRTKDRDIISTTTTLAFRPTLTVMDPEAVANTLKEVLGIEDETPAPEAKPAKKPTAKKAAAKTAA